MAYVTILTVNYNTHRFIELCLKSIYKNTTLPFRLIVVDNGSTDGSLDYLQRVRQAEQAIVLTRRTSLSASEHGRALDFVLYRTGYVKTPLVCTIDSDAFAAKKGWLKELDKQRNGHFAVGYEHFRDSRCLHPACMLFDYKKLRGLGDPSFALVKKGGRFFDTGIAVSESALAKGYRLVGARGLEQLVPHRWCATRIQKVSGDQKLDNRVTRSEFTQQNDRWFTRPDVQAIFQK
jgi:GT2 family glycosyltransferase